LEANTQHAIALFIGTANEGRKCGLQKKQGEKRSACVRAVLLLVVQCSGRLAPLQRKDVGAIRLVTVRRTSVNCCAAVARHLCAASVVGNSCIIDRSQRASTVAAQHFVYTYERDGEMRPRPHPVRESSLPFCAVRPL